MKFHLKENLINSSKLLNDDRDSLIKVLNIIERAVKYYSIEYTSFLSPSTYVLINDFVIDSNFLITYFGGINSAERKIAIIRPNYESIGYDEIPIMAIEIKYSEKFANISHRDVLGSLMSLGIKRETIGDIYVHEGFCHILIKKSIFEYLILNFKKIGRNPITIKEIKFNKIEYKEPNYSLINTTVGSNRLDSIISKGFNIDRNSSKKKIKMLMVKVNHKVVESAHLTLNENDLISVKGEGRIILFKINGNTKKDRLKIVIKKII
ncbi:YlmH/Sll1252 family protein [Clostridiaceae bacterium HSG29]|nr:YlmH/Sll1252 family protein [Clostridiaceae bacterium HSG29]